MNIFITGGSRGIGRDILMTAVKQGHNVAFTYQNPETDVGKIIQEAKELRADCRCIGYRLDVKNSDEVNDVVDQVSDDFEHIHGVVNNAGVNRNALAFNMSDEEWHEVIETNLSGAFYVIRGFLPLFLSNKKGRFIHVSSVAKDGFTGQANYSASKAGLEGLSGTIAKEYGSKGITSNVIAPGMFETDMTKKTLSEKHKKFWDEVCPLKRIGEVGEVSALVLFLLSDEASFINGQVISVTGGLDWVI